MIYIRKVVEKIVVKERIQLIFHLKNGFTKSISRFARNTLDTLKYVRQLKEKGVAIFFEKECARK